jgi:hypothetical protein
MEAGDAKWVATSLDIAFCCKRPQQTLQIVRTKQQVGEKITSQLSELKL